MVMALLYILHSYQLHRNFPKRYRSPESEAGALAHTCNPSSSGGRGKRFEIQGLPGLKHETLFKKIL
jgi:hypothetical protein